MNNSTYQNCLRKIQRIERGLNSLDCLVLIDSDLVDGRIGYNEAMNRLSRIKIPVTIKPETQVQIPVQTQ